MAFYGCDFTFNGKRASDFGLMVYNIGSYGQDDVDFSVGEIMEDRINSRFDSLLYGLVQNEPLVFTLVFGITPDALNGEAYLTRSKIAEITEWLTGHQTYKILTIDQPDMNGYRYHAMVTGLKLIADGGLPVAFSAEISCDGPFAYKDPSSYILSLDGTTKVYLIDNQGRTNGVFYPIFDVDLTDASYIRLENSSDGGRVMQIDDIPSGSISIHIDCQNQIISTNTGYNLYPGFNMKFLRIIPGENHISVTTDGTGEIRTTCEFPVNIGA